MGHFESFRNGHIIDMVPILDSSVNIGHYHIIG